MKTKSAPVTVSDLVQFFEEKAPSATAEKWDNVGLLVGNSKDRVKGVVVSIDLTSESIQVAKKTGANVIVDHHPCIFPKQKGLARVVDQGSSSLVFQAAQAGISVIASHTNFDQCALEVSERISKKLGCEIRGRLFEGDLSRFLKLAVFVPSTHLEKVRDAICEAGAGKIGAYDYCSFSTEGEGTFRGGASTRPFLGKPGKLEKAQEHRLEVIFPKYRKASVLRSLRAAHPYEEIAYDLYLLEQEPVQSSFISGLGYGFVGEFQSPVEILKLEQKIKKTFQVKHFIVTPSETGELKKKIRKIGFVAGKGSSFLGAARAAGCDLFITGETGYHDAREAALSGLSVMELGHRESELYFLEVVKDWVKGLNIPVQLIHTPIQGVR